MPLYIVRKRFGFFKRVRVTVQEYGVGGVCAHGPERWRCSFRYIWDADTFVLGLCKNSDLYRAVDADYSKPAVFP